ncbi:MAG: hypothetical protein KKE20_00385 [Nanoarchaeota archaeon]|nr:hypothetical protein [Nanoarchaeota archaeon]
MAKKQVIISLVVLSLMILLPIFVSAQEKTEVYIFERAGCIHCANIDVFLDGLSSEYDFEIKSYDITDPKNAEYLQKLAISYGIEVQGVPTVFIGDQVFVGDASSTKEAIKERITSCSGSVCPIKDVDGKLSQSLTLPAVIAAAAVDAINPCAFAVLIILLTTILAAKIRKRVLYAGLAFSLSIYIAYFLMGVGLFSAIQVTGLTHTFYFIVAILAIIIGLFNLKDYLWYGRWFIMEVPRAWRPRMKLLLKGVTSVPGAFFVGFLVSLFLLPCTSGPYIVILGLLSKTATRHTAMLLLLLYNFIFILPMILITFAIYFGFTTTKQAEEWRQRKLKILHLIAGIIILLLGVFMLISLYTGLF